MRAIMSPSRKLSWLSPLDRYAYSALASCVSHPGPLSGTAIDFGLVGVSGSKTETLDICISVCDIDTEFHSFNIPTQNSVRSVCLGGTKQSTHLARVSAWRQ